MASPSCIFSMLWLPCASAPLAENRIPIANARTGVTRLRRLSMMQQTQTWTWTDLRGLSVGDVGDVSRRDYRVDRHKEKGEVAWRWERKEQQSRRSWRWCNAMRCDNATRVNRALSRCNAALPLPLPLPLSLGWSRIVFDGYGAKSYRNCRAMPPPSPTQAGESSWP